MKAIILAAGRGTRLGVYTKYRPKCLLQLGGKSLLQWQIRLLQDSGIKDIVIVRGFASHMISVDGARYYNNPRYATTNMVHSLFCAEPELNGEVLITYGDIIYDASIINSVMRSESKNVGVVVDIDWKEYYTERFGDPYAEAESLIIDDSGRILRIGEELPRPEEVQGRYVGLIKLTSTGSQLFRQIYKACREHDNDDGFFRGRALSQIFMTDFIQIVINRDVEVQAIPVHRGWIEFDTEVDYRSALAWYDTGSIARYCSLPSG